MEIYGTICRDTMHAGLKTRIGALKRRQQLYIRGQSSQPV